MAVSLRDRFKNSWNAFMSREPTKLSYGPSFGLRPDRARFNSSNKQSIVSSIYNQIAIDCAAVKINHCEVNENDKFKQSMDSTLNECLTVEANIDQTGRAFIQDIVMSMLDEGTVAVVITDAVNDPRYTDSYDILSLRTGKIVEWYPDSVKVNVYDDRTGDRKDLILPKRCVAIIENPLFSIINESNSTLKRLVRKINLLDYIDEQSSSGKLDLIFQLPYVIKTEAKRQEAERRRKEIERQLSGSKYGIAYTDGTERITQLNRSVENNLFQQIQYLTQRLYNQLGLTEAVFNGTADEATMLNYYNRTIEPILSAITDELTRKFLSKNLRTRGQAIMFFRDPFRLVPTDKMAEIADKYTRNEILSTNEVRAIIGYKPAKDPRADELRNKNLNQPEGYRAVSLNDNAYSNNTQTEQIDYVSLGKQLLGM